LEKTRYHDYAEHQYSNWLKFPSAYRITKFIASGPTDEASGGPNNGGG
jgi:hypothetical protein